jgi:MoaA/NifB/PqqE/SkfB family radical SAM enzyme
MLGLTVRMLTEPDPRLLARFAVNFGWKGLRAVQRYQRGLRRGETIPAFMIISVTNYCNLRCQGCWVTPTSPPVELSVDALDGIIAASKRQGSYFFGILGGEPLLHRGLFGVLARHPDCYFQVFTNGHPITDGVAAELRRLGNASPLVSIEGDAAVSDARRGGSGVFHRTLQGLERCVRAGLVTGVASSLCRTNVDGLASDAWLRELVRLGVHYVWYYVYRPVGPRPAEDLALSPDQVVALRRFLVEARTRHPIAIIDAYWDADGAALCPMAVGISHHIGPTGGIEPCPVIQVAAAWRLFSFKPRAS